MPAKPLWQAEKSVDEALAKLLIEESFPGLAPVTLRLLGEGWDNMAYLVNEQFVFRFPRRSIAVPLLLAEHRVLGAIGSKLPLPAPVPLYFAEPDAMVPLNKPGRAGVPEPSRQTFQGYGWPFLGYRFIEGITACRANLQEGDRVAMAPLLGRFLKVLHAVPLEEARSAGAEPDKIGKLDIPTRIEKTRVRLEELENGALISSGQRCAIEAIFDHAKDLPTRDRECLLHGDLYARHLLVNHGKLVGVIDWGDVSLGHPAIDLCVMHTFLSGESRGLFLESYGGVEPATNALARFRAACHCAAVLSYAADVGDEPLKSESLRSVHNLLSE